MLADIAGVKLPSQRKREIKNDSSFEEDMENELDVSFRRHNAEWAGGTSAINASSSEKQSIGETSGQSNKKPKESKKPVKIDKKKPNNEEDADPALGLNDQGTESDEGNKIFQFIIF